MKTASHLLLFICLNILIGQVDYQTQIQTIFNSNCTSCHVNGGSYFGGLDLSTYANVMNGGNSGVVVIPNDHANSYLWQRVNNGEMPPEANPDLSVSQVDLIALWINEGALENPDNFPPSDFSLLTPENGDTVYINLSNQNDSLLFQWEESIDPDGDSIQYIFGIVKVGGWGAPSFTLMYEDTLEQTHLSLSNIFIADSIAEIEEPDDTNDLVGCIWYVHAFDGLELNEQHHGLALDFSGYLELYNEVLPRDFVVHPAFPNPFNPVTTLRYDLPENGLVSITIYDMLGREVKTLINQTQDAGFKSVIWDATNDYGKPVSAGIYLYKIQTGEYMQTKKMVLLK